MFRSLKGALFIVGPLILLWSGGRAEAASVVVLKQTGSDAAIVFVHGLGGSAKDSFTNETLTPPLSWSDLVAADRRSITAMHSPPRLMCQWRGYRSRLPSRLKRKA